MSEKDDLEQADQIVARGAALLREKHYIAAVESLEAALSLVPGHKDAERYLRFARVGAKGVSRAKGETTGTSSESTIPAGDFKVLRPAKRRRAKARTEKRHWTEESGDS